jgi:hypothetical protein
VTAAVTGTAARPTQMATTADTFFIEHTTPSEAQS